MMKQFFFNNWEGVLRVGLTSLIAYLLVVILLRVSGKRTLGKMNAYDFVVTIALGSILGAVILNKTVPLVEGVAAIVALITMQFLFSSLSVRFPWFRKLVTSETKLLYYKNEFLKKNLRRQRITEDEVNKAVRASGEFNYSNIEIIIMEPTGDITVIKKNNGFKDLTALSDVSQI